jgi:hypothetical protein
LARNPSLGLHIGLGHLLLFSQQSLKKFKMALNYAACLRDQWAMRYSYNPNTLLEVAPTRPLPCSLINELCSNTSFQWGTVYAPSPASPLALAAQAFGWFLRELFPGPPLMGGSGGGAVVFSFSLLASINHHNVSAATANRPWRANRKSLVLERSYRTNANGPAYNAHR